MLITSPLAFPISLILDAILGDEIGTVYTRNRLTELLKVTENRHDMNKEEVDIVTGALNLQRKTAKNVMTKLKYCYMLPADTTLGFDTMVDIIIYLYYIYTLENSTTTNGIIIITTQKAVTTTFTTPYLIYIC